MKTLGYFDFKTKKVYTSKSEFNSLQAKRKKREDQKAHKAIEYAEQQHLSRAIDQLKAKFN